MNAESRTLLKVRLDDVAAARRFSRRYGRKRGKPPQIHRGNALEVVNLDI